MSEYTPGPWATSPDGVPDAFRPQITVYAESDGGRVATVFREEANARLIAAAPALAEALLRWVREGKECASVNHFDLSDASTAFAQARAALKQAGIEE